MGNWIASDKRALVFVKFQKKKNPKIYELKRDFGQLIQV